MYSMGDVLFVCSFTCCASPSNSNLFRVPHVDNFSHRALRIHEPEQPFYGVAHIHESGAFLLAFPKMLMGVLSSADFTKFGSTIP